MSRTDPPNGTVSVGSLGESLIDRKAKVVGSLCPGKPSPAVVIRLQFRPRPHQWRVGLKVGYPPQIPFGQLCPPWPGGSLPGPPLLTSVDALCRQPANDPTCPTAPFL